MSRFDPPLPGREGSERDKGLKTTKRERKEERKRRKGKGERNT